MVVEVFTFEYTETSPSDTGIPPDAVTSIFSFTSTLPVDDTLMLPIP